jgi:RpiB/LacA/LacB family sugar-phosphate isomerase
MRVAIGSDHAGFDLKEAVKAFLAEDRTEVVDVGGFSRDPVDYPDCAEAIGAALRDRRADRAILLCGSGVGASMAANKIPGIRPVRLEHAHWARRRYKSSWRCATSRMPPMCCGRCTS